MTAAGTPAEPSGAERGPVRPGRAAAERAGQRCGRRAARRDARAPLQAPEDTAAQPPPGDPGRGQAAPAPGSARRATTPRVRARGPSSPATRARYASALCLQLGPVLPASTGPSRDGVGAAPPTRAMGRPLGTEQPPEA